MKKIAKTGAAFGLAALTLASSLTIGAAANAAPTSDPRATPTPLAEEHEVMPLIAKSADGSFWGMQDTPGRYLVRNAGGSYSDAKEFASEFKVPRAGTWGHIWSADGRYCITETGNGYIQFDPSSGPICTGTQSLFSVAEDGTLTTKNWPGHELLSNAHSASRPAFSFASSTNPAAKLVIQAAETKSVDVYERTAVVSGKAEPGSTVTVKGGSTNKTVPADATTGEWTTTVKGLALGENPFTVEAFDDKGESVGSSEFTVEVPVTPLSAAVKSTSVFAGSAVVEVTGTPGLLLDYQGLEVELDPDGKAVVRVEGLQTGPNTVRFQQFDVADKIGEDLDYDIMLTARNVTATSSFDDSNVDADAVLSGTAEPQSQITITDGNSKVTTTTTNEAGEWSTPVTAPGASLQSFTVTQSINAIDAGSTTITLNYGSAIDMTSPREGSSFTGGTLTFRGDGQKTADVEITEKGVDGPLATTGTTASGEWTVKVPDVDGDFKHEYTATMHSKGNLTTTSTVTINPGKPDLGFGTLAVTNPDAAQLAAGYTPYAAYTFRGTGKPNSTITVENIWGTKFGTVPVDNTGTWAWTRTSMGKYTWQLNFVQDKGGQMEKTVQVLDFKPGAETVKPGTPVVITNPADVSVGYVPGSSFTFTGTAAPNTPITVENAYGTKMGATQSDAKGDWSFTRTDMGTYNWTLHFIAGKGTDTEQRGILTGFKPNENASPVQLTTPTPAQIAAGYTPNSSLTFEGTGTPGKTITIQNIWGTKFGTATVDDTGHWDWTRKNMGTYTWQLDFIQDQGTKDEARASLRDFAPRP